MKNRFTVSILIVIFLLVTTIGNLMSQPNIIFITDDNNDDYQIEFLNDQGFDVLKIWGGVNISTWGADTLAMLDTADLIIVGRSVISTVMQTIEDRTVWNSLNAPLISNSPWCMRNTRSHWINTTVAFHSTYTQVEVKIPEDTIFSSVNIDTNNTLHWFRQSTDVILDLSGDCQGEIVATIGDTIPIVVRFEANKAFYTGGPDSAVAPRIYFGFGMEDFSGEAIKAAYFPLTRAAKQVYLAEICRILQIPAQEAVYRNRDYDILFLSDDFRDDPHIEFLRDHEFKVTKFWKAIQIADWEQESIDSLNNADLVICGRYLQSAEFRSAEDRVAFNSIAAPLILNNMYIAMNTRANWFNSTSIQSFFEPKTAKVMVPSDTIFHEAPIDPVDNSLPWFADSTEYLINTASNNGAKLVTIDDAVPLVVRFIPDVPFYPGTTDSPKGPRTYFGFGTVPGVFSTNPGKIPLSEDAKNVYVSEIIRMMKGGIMNTDNTLSSLSVDKGMFSPAFHKDSLNYTLVLDAEPGTIVITAIPAEQTSIVTGDGAINIPEGNDTTLYITCTSEIGHARTYSISIIVKSTGIDDRIENIAKCNIYPNPVIDKVVIDATETISNIYVSNLQGAVIFSKVVNAEYVEFSLGNLKPGIYFIRIQAGDKNYINKIIKN